MNYSSKHFKFVVIGGGSAGYAAARTALKYTESVAVIDGAKELGGLCILHGCMPSKTLIYSAELLHLAQNGPTFGFAKTTEKPRIDMKSLQDRKRFIINDFAQYRQEQLNTGDFTLIRSYAHFKDDRTLELDDGSLVTADTFLIATGSAPATPALPGLQEAEALTSSEVLDLEEVPDSTVVLGGGVVAAELSQFLSRVGSKVTIIQRSEHILKEMPVDAAEVVEQAFRDEGINLYTNTAIKDIEREDGGYRVSFEDLNQSKSISVSGSRLFNALGRNPNTSKLGLDNTGVELDKKGQVVTNGFQQSSVPHIYAAGDCAGPHEIVHIAILQGELAAKHALRQDSAMATQYHSITPIQYSDITHIVFTDPQIGIAGRMESELEAEGVDYIVESYPFDDHGKSILMEAKYGFVKVLAEAGTGKVLGAQCVSKDASELIHAMSVAITLGATVDDLLKVHWYHPTLSEIWTYPLESISDNINSY